MQRAHKSGKLRLVENLHFELEVNVASTQPELIQLCNPITQYQRQLRF